MGRLNPLVGALISELLALSFQGKFLRQASAHGHDLTLTMLSEHLSLSLATSSFQRTGPRLLPDPCMCESLS